jgi:hypothetical protein
VSLQFNPFDVCAEIKFDIDASVNANSKPRLIGINAKQTYVADNLQLGQPLFADYVFISANFIQPLIIDQ